MWDWGAGCPHWPGDVVDIKDPDTGKVIETVTVYASVVNARLSEVSIVYDGATPGAGLGLNNNSRQFLRGIVHKLLVRPAAST